MRETMFRVWEPKEESEKPKELFFRLVENPDVEDILLECGTEEEMKKHCCWQVLVIDSKGLCLYPGIEAEVGLAVDKTGTIKTRRP